jgi:hypothetical protein
MTAKKMIVGSYELYGTTMDSLQFEQRWDAMKYP